MHLGLQISFQLQIFHKTKFLGSDKETCILSKINIKKYQEMLLYNFSERLVRVINKLKHSCKHITLHLS